MTCRIPDRGQRGDPPGAIHTGAVRADAAHAKATICAVFLPSNSKASALKAMSSPNQRACSAASAWQYALTIRPR